MLSNIAVVGSLFAANIVHAFTPHRNHYSNYAGGASYDTDIVEVSADFVLPECKLGLPNYEYVTYTNNGWVGMSAFTEDSGLLQTGVSCYVSEIKGNKTLSYTAWSEWAPAASDFYDDHDYQPGDVITARVVAYNESSGASWIRNHRTGKEHHTLYVNQTVPLSFTNAEWVVESELTISIVGVSGQRNAGFAPWKFSNAAYKKKDGSTHLMGGSEIYNCVLNGTQIFTATYEGPGCLQVNDTTPANYNPGV